MAASSLAYADDRQMDREEVHYRARATGPGGRPLRFLVVNISAHGLMARCDDPLSVGDTVRVNLPVVGAISAEVRWALGGRAGLQFTRMIDMAPYYELIAVLVRTG
jgi:hypothetical protein